MTKEFKNVEQQIEILKSRGLIIKNIQYLISSIQKEIADAIDKKEYINHYIMKHGYVPLWVLVNTLTLGTISKFQYFREIYVLTMKDYRIQLL